MPKSLIIKPIDPLVPSVFVQKHSKRILKEIMKPDEEYPSSYLIQNLRIAYKDWIDFCKRNVPAFLAVDGKNKWRVYKLVVERSEWMMPVNGLQDGLG